VEWPEPCCRHNNCPFLTSDIHPRTAGFLVCPFIYEIFQFWKIICSHQCHTFQLTILKQSESLPKHILPVGWQKFLSRTLQELIIHGKLTVAQTAKITNNPYLQFRTNYVLFRYLKHENVHRQHAKLRCGSANAPRAVTSANNQTFLHFTSRQNSYWRCIVFLEVGTIYKYYFDESELAWRSQQPTANGLQPGWLGSIPGRDQTHFSLPLRPSWPWGPSRRWVRVAISPAEKRQGGAPDHSHLVPRLKATWSCTSTTPMS
jgi:hypothetical protein